jgi:hypothetical protein
MAAAKTAFSNLRFIKTVSPEGLGGQKIGRSKWMGGLHFNRPDISRFVVNILATDDLIL